MSMHHKNDLVKKQVDVFKKQVNDYNLIASAWHESGHAVCGLHNYLMVFNVNVIAPHYNMGNTEYFYYDVSSYQDHYLIKLFAILDLQATYAGLLAERLYYENICGSDKFPMHLKIGSSDDINLASKEIRKYKLALPGKETFNLKKKIKNDTGKILTEHWQSVKLVAHRLYQKKQLSFDDLKYILTRQTDQKEFWKDRFRKIKIIHAVTPPAPEDVRKLIE
jgi:hypothetical protein